MTASPGRPVHKAVSDRIKTSVKKFRVAVNKNTGGAAKPSSKPARAGAGGSDK
jgi:hypothetical protein